jgi:hypothetical protein
MLATPILANGVAGRSGMAWGGLATPWTEKKKKKKQDRFFPWGVYGGGSATSRAKREKQN